MGMDCHKKSEQRDSERPVNQAHNSGIIVKAKEVMGILYQGSVTVKFIVESTLWFFLF